jgi:hypothetical protein
MLARIIPARVGFDFRTFECPQCALVHEVNGRLRSIRTIIYATGLGSYVGQAAMLGLAMTLMIQRVGLLDLTSMTEQTNPVTGDPSTVTVVFWPRC